MSLKALIQSHRNFVEKHQKKYHEIFQEFVEKGQSPKTLFIGSGEIASFNPESHAFEPLVSQVTA